jgi:hypothetical protein
MARPKHTPEIIIGKLREVEVLVAKADAVPVAWNTAACVSTRRGD